MRFILKDGLTIEIYSIEDVNMLLASMPFLRHVSQEEYEPSDESDDQNTVRSKEESRCVAYKAAIDFEIENAPQAKWQEIQQRAARKLDVSAKTLLRHGYARDPRTRKDK